LVLQRSGMNQSYLYSSSQDSQLLCQFWLLFVVLHGELDARVCNKYFVYQGHQIHVQIQVGVQGLPDAGDERVPESKE